MSRGFVVADLESTPTSVRCAASVPADLEFFAGHFDGYPVLAGVAQIDGLVLEIAYAAFPELGAVRRLSRVKFRHVISPGDQLQVELTRTNEALAFAISRDGELCSSGQLHFGRGTS